MLTRLEFVVTEDESFPELWREVDLDREKEIGLDGGLRLPVVAENLDALPEKIIRN